MKDTSTVPSPLLTMTRFHPTSHNWAYRDKGGRLRATCEVLKAERGSHGAVLRITVDESEVFSTVVSGYSQKPPDEFRDVWHNVRLAAYALDIDPDGTGEDGWTNVIPSTLKGERTYFTAQCEHVLTRTSSYKDTGAPDGFRYYLKCVSCEKSRPITAEEHGYHAASGSILPVLV